MSRRHAPVFALAALLAVCAGPARAGFSGNDLVIPAVARRAGQSPAQFYSTLWVTNPSSASSVKVTMSLLLQGQANPTPKSVTETLTPGETKRYDNVVQTVFGLTESSGAIRLVADGKILASSRTYDLPAGADLKDVKGLFLGAVPVSFAIGLGESTQLQGVTQGASEDYRYNFGFVEVSGQTATARVTLRGPNGVGLATKDYALAAYEARQVNVGDLGAPGTTNGRLEIAVVSGSGKLVLYGTQIANGSQDSAGFEMSFKDGLLAENTASSAENVAASTTATTASVVQKTVEIAPQLGGVGGRTALADPPFEATYDAATGFWTVHLSLPSGQSATLAIQFKDSGGTVQKLFNPLTTNTITSRGVAAGLQGLLSFDLILTGVKQGVASVTANGSGSATYQGVSAAVQISSLVVPKTPGSYPSSGTISVTSNGITVTVAFNGTRYATGTYTYRNQSFTFTIDLQTGEVTK